MILQYFCWIDEKLQCGLQFFRLWRMSIRESVISPLLWEKPQLGSECCCTRKNPTRGHTSSDKQVSLFPELKKSLVSMLITLKCRSSHRSKGRLFACFSTKTLWTSWLCLHLSDQKDKKFANAKEKPNEKIAVLLDAQNLEMASLAFQQAKYNILPLTTTSVKIITLSPVFLSYGQWEITQP